MPRFWICFRKSLSSSPDLNYLRKSSFNKSSFFITVQSLKLNKKIPRGATLGIFNLHSLCDSAVLLYNLSIKEQLYTHQLIFRHFRLKHLTLELFLKPLMQHQTLLLNYRFQRYILHLPLLVYQQKLFHLQH